MDNAEFGRLIKTLKNQKDVDGLFELIEKYIDAQFISKQKVMAAIKEALFENENTASTGNIAIFTEEIVIGISDNLGIDRKHLGKEQEKEVK
ncbi:hypothetical protein LCGC14_0464890 [marine sediment metagenome]|uniref:Uncharacterized protein n=1 Tax=marine sediment metagenome TaxID=412755 RepID=A0A0F9SWZ0_9ZZZZ